MLPLLAFGQTKTYYDQEGYVVDSSAVFDCYLETSRQKNGWTYAKEFSNENVLRSEGAFSVYTDKLKIAEGLHKNYRRGSGELWYTSEYRADKLIQLQSFYPSGKLKRIEQYSKKGKLKSGQCYQEDGSERKYTAFNLLPEYPGGLETLLDYLYSNVKYPDLARKNNIQGVVTITFFVMEDGSIENVKVVKGVGGGCSAEGMRVVKAMPRWSPGILDDEPVKVRYTLPIRFKLE